MKLLEPRGGVSTPRDQHFPERAAVDAYGNGGFRFAGMSHRGSILCVPSGIHGWAVASAGEIDTVSLARVFEEAADVEVLLLGTGRDLVRPGPEVREAIAAAGLRFDVMPTGAAARTYNIMLGERRKVAAALVAVA